MDTKCQDLRFFTINPNSHNLNHSQAKNAKKLYFGHLSPHFSKWRLFFKFWFFDHSSESFALTATKSGATDLSHRDGHFGGICKFVSRIFGSVERKNSNFYDWRYLAIP